MNGILYIVGTPIGNLEDMTFRSVRILNEVDLIAAEDTRVTKKLMSHFNIHTEIISYHRHSNEKRENEIIDILQTGKDVALVTDAGMPAISDPGYELVAKAVSEGVKVVPIPGVSSVVTALSVSGFNSDKFLFLGFLPRSKKEIVKAVSQTLKTFPPVCSVAFEAPHRINKTLKIFSEISPDLQIVIARELTKKFEELIRGSASELAKQSLEFKGEIVVIWSMPYNTEQAKNEATEEAEENLLNAFDFACQEMERGVSLKSAAQNAKEKFNVSKKEVYDKLLKKD